MTVKRILSVFLALVLALSLGVVAIAAEDGGNWMPIPTSPEGLADGTVYLDFTRFVTETMSSGETPASDAEIARAIQIYISGTWLFNYDEARLKGTITVPADASESGSEEVVDIAADNATAMLPFILKEVGAQWLPVAKSTEFLWDGDYYIDLDACTPEQINFLEDVEIFYNPGSTYMELMFTPDHLQFVYYPLNKDSIGHLVQDLELRTFTDPYTWTPIPTSPDGLADGDYYLDFSFDWDAWSPDVRQNRVELFNGGTWYVDHQNKMLRGSFTVPAEMSETGEAYVRSIQPNRDMYLQTIMRVGDWVRIPTSPDGLSAGDFYMDVPALATVLGTTEAELDGAEYYGDAISGDIYLACEGHYRLYFGDDRGVLNCMKEIVNTEPSAEPENPGTSDEPEQRPTLWKSIASFFLRVIEFFRRLFNVR